MERKDKAAKTELMKQKLPYRTQKEVIQEVMKEKQVRPGYIDKLKELYR